MSLVTESGSQEHGGWWRTVSLGLLHSRGSSLLGSINPAHRPSSSLGQDAVEGTSVSPDASFLGDFLLPTPPHDLFLMQTPWKIFFSKLL